MEEYRVANRELAPMGFKKIDWAWHAMPVLRFLEEREKERLPLQGVTVACCLHLEAKTACLLQVLHRLGATVAAAGSNPLSTQDDVCAALASSGVHVFSHHGMSSAEYGENLRRCLAWNPQVLIDDGGDLVALIHEERRDLIPRLRGGCEETTTGIKRLKAMEAEGALKFPMLAVNDGLSKHLFDNRYGTGQSVWDAILRTTNLLVAGRVVVVVGYGWCGKGVAKRASGLGARVAVVEIDPHRALEAFMDGFEVLDLRQAAAVGDVFVTVTGNTQVLREEHFRLMKDGALLANAGHFDVEVCIPHLKALSVEVWDSRPQIRSYRMEDGRTLHLLGEGRLVNLAAGDGHPVEIMDLSFALQLLSALHVHQNDLTPGVHKVPEELDRRVARAKLDAMGLRLETLTPEQETYLASWRE